MTILTKVIYRVNIVLTQISGAFFTARRNKVSKLRRYCGTKRKERREGRRDGGRKEEQKGGREKGMEGERKEKKRKGKKSQSIFN